MFDQIITIYEMCIRFLLNLNIFEFQNEIVGCVAVFLLILIALAIRKRRKLKKSPARGAVSEDTVSPSWPDFDSGEETAAAQSGDLAGSDEPAVEETITTQEEQAPVEQFPEPAADTRAKKRVETIAENKAEPEKRTEKTTDRLPETPTERAGFLDRLKSGLSKTRKSLSARFDSILSGNRAIDDDVLEEIEEVLITSDIGVPTTMELMQRIEKKAATISSPEAFKAELKKEMLSLVDIAYHDTVMEKPHVIMVVGVNGVGKTTTIGKLAAQYAAQGKKVLLSASDTFRAAAVEQLEIWASRSGADIVKHRDKSDPAAVAFDSVEAAVARGVDVVIVDTAGRLHTKVNLMEELKKIKRSIGKTIPSAPHDTFLVVDATTGQNAVSQAKLFNENIDITGIILTKLDGTAKGGIVLSICNTLNVPIRYIGIGEGIDDLQTFDPKLFVDALL